ncbi:MAG TPA: hypothetical protein VLL08_11720, partial [Kineosporiaceae bacterium]|nr:hypothetical protein [Kineosporiaceae bacterium]
MFPIRPFRSLRGPGLALFGLLACAGCSPSGPAAPPTSQVTSTAGPIATPSAIAPAGTGPASPPIRTTGPVGAVIAPAEACAQKAFGELTASQRAGQLVMAGVPAGDPGSYRTLVRQQRLGSVFLAGRTSDSPATIKRALATLGVQKTKSTTIKPLVSVDQEGGKVQSL